MTRRTNSDLYERLGEIGARVEAVGDQVGELKEVSVKRLDDHAGRLRKIETGGARRNGALAVIAMLASGLGLDKLLSLWK